MRLVNNVTVTNPDSGVRETFGPTDRVPDWAAELIANPSAWTEGEPLRSTASIDDWSESIVELDLDSQTHKKLVRAVERLGIEAPKSGGKTVLSDIIMNFLFEDEVPETIDLLGNPDLMAGMPPEPVFAGAPPAPGGTGG